MMLGWFGEGNTTRDATNDVVFPLRLAAAEICRCEGKDRRETAAAAFLLQLRIRFSLRRRGLDLEAW